MITTYIYNKRFRIIFHLLFWISYLIVFTFQSGYTRSDYFLTFISYCFYLPVIIFATYFNIYFTIPHFLLAKKYKTFIIVTLISALIFVILQRSIIVYIMSPLLYTPEVIASIKSYGVFYPSLMLSNMFSIYMVVAVAAFIKLLKIWFVEQQRQKEFETERLEAELNFLKAQIHPHFLFNLLNNLYSLTLHKSDLAPEMILKLSSLLDYMLYQSNSRFVPLEKELELINDFIELEKLRYGNKLNINFNISGKENNIEIIPLILFPFVENAFKHGVSNETEKALIDIQVQKNNASLLFNIENSISKDTNLKSSGLGLKNVKRRLELIYKKNFDLNISENNNKFTVCLRIDFINYEN